MSENKLNQDYKQNSTVLLVDDLAENLQVLGNILDENDIEFSYATSGKEALDAVAFKKPDLILLDINMPEMNGFEVCKKLKKDPETMDIPIIFLTAKADSEDIVEGLSIGAVDYVTKPFNTKELLSRVFTHLELFNSRKMIRKQNEELREMIDTKNKFFSIIAHDLRGPFNTLLGFSDLALKEFDHMDPEEIRDMIKHIHSSSVRGFELLNNLLEWSRSQTGRIKCEPIDFSLSPFRLVTFFTSSPLHLFSFSSLKDNIKFNDASQVSQKKICCLHLSYYLPIFLHHSFLQTPYKE